MAGLFDPSAVVRLSLTPGTGVTADSELRYKIAALAVSSGFVLCDVDKNGVVDVIDVQQLINEVLGINRCTADIDNDSRCTVTDVQRVANDVLNGTCVTGP
jgi:hypothetical protein